VTEHTQTAPRPSKASGLDGFFKITERGSTVGREVRGGLVTFLTMAYIIVLNPLILGFVPDSTGAFLGGGAEPGSGIPAIAAGTALVAGALTILMGGFANFPLALATGLGLNAFVANSIARQSTWGAAMGLVVLEGIIILLLVFSLLLADFFDTMGTMTAIGAEAGLNDEEGTPPGAQKILIVDSVAAIAGGAAGVSSNTSYIESASGVGEGARTGLASVVTGALFLLATFFTPLVAAIPSEAAVPALVLVGFLMMQLVT
jgi:xanthine/uracil/vitamin C permease (AzgA family)